MMTFTLYKITLFDAGRSKSTYKPTRYFGGGFFREPLENFLSASCRKHMQLRSLVTYSTIGF